MTACGTAPPRYIVTASPIDVGATSPPLCIAIDAHDPRGVWWWEPGRPGCAGRSTGPGVFHGDHASVNTGSRPGVIDASFRLQRRRAPAGADPAFVDVRLILESDTMRSPDSRTVVSTIRRADLELPESAPRDRRQTPPAERR